MKQYQHYLLDWDECIGQTLQPWLNGYRETYKEFGVPQTDEEIASFSFGNQYGPLERGIDDLDSFMEALMRNIHEDLKVVDLYPGAREFISTLKDKGKNIVLATSSPRFVIEAALQHNHLVDSFDAVVTADEVSKHKPNPEMIFKALAAISIKDGLKDTVIVGDSKSDLGAANNAGIDSILFYPDSHSTLYSIKDLKGLNPTYIFGSFEDISKAVS